MDKRVNEQTERLRRQVQMEINMHKVDIDRKVFVKTQKEKDDLKVAKSSYKLNETRRKALLGQL